MSVFLQSLGYALDFDDTLVITDYKGEEQGQLSISVVPCNRNGTPLGEDFYIEEPAELLGQKFGFKITIKSVDVNKLRFSKGMKVSYTPFKQEQATVTPMLQGTTPQFNHSAVFYFDKVTAELLDWFDSGCLTLKVEAAQEDTKVDPKLVHMNTKELRSIQDYSAPQFENRPNTAAYV